MDMANHPLLALATDDPPPLPSAYPQLRRLDRSMCIRSSLDVMKKCPTCNEPATEGSIRRNRALEEIADAWEESRSTLINLTQPTPTLRKRPPTDPNSRASSSNSANNVKHRKLGSRSRSASPGKRSASDAEVIEIPGSDDIEPEEEIAEELTDRDEAPCPICSIKLPISAIPMHIERGCPPPKAVKANGMGNQKADWRRVFAGAGMGKGKEVELKRITKPNYSLATPAELKAILMEYGLPVSGDRPSLETRVQEWIILWNSNLDTSHPRSLPSLRAKLNEAEASRKRDKEKGKEALGQKLGTAEGMKQYVAEKKGEFERLRLEIMARDKKRREADSGTGKDSAIEVD